jgi:hypothetical protein
LIVVWLIIRHFPGASVENQNSEYAGDVHLSGELVALAGGR